METAPFDLSSFWTWFLLFTRLSGVFLLLPGIGTEEVPMPFRAALIMLLSLVMAVAGVHVALPATVAEAGLMIATEFLLGIVLGAIPTMIIASLALCGQVTSAAIGLGQASLIDPSLGESVSVLSRVQTLIATALFLLIDGHHTILRAAFSVASDVGVGTFRPGENTAALLADRFQASFDLAITVAAPILVTILITQFVLGLVTKFVPQVNIFIISLPLTIGIGLFVLEFTLPAMVQQLLAQFRLLEELTVRAMLGA